MTPHNITNSANNLKITELALYNIVEFQAFGSRPLRKRAANHRLVALFVLPLHTPSLPTTLRLRCECSRLPLPMPDSQSHCCFEIIDAKQIRYGKRIMRADIMNRMANTDMR